MKSDNLSYSEAYTNFLAYCVQKDGVSMRNLVMVFRDNGVEKDFKDLYDSGKRMSNSKYYKRIKGVR